MQSDVSESFDARVIEAEGAALHSVEIDTIQVNIGLLCNLKCVHCHVTAGPNRKELMDWPTMQEVLRAARAAGVSLIDITGGAPEMNPHFAEFIRAIRTSGMRAQVRTNLTILLEPGYQDMAEFMRDHGVWLVASMPCYLKDNVDAQRGEGVYDGSIRALQLLNTLGYGVREDLPLTLVYNPQGPALPPDQAKLEADYRRELDQRFGIQFTRLFTIANMPTGRFMGWLRRQKKDAAYRDLLQASFNSATLHGLMCRHLISVDWDGNLYDCDFNLSLRLPVNHGVPSHIREFDVGALRQRRIVTGDHCFACTAGCGSSCGGVLV